MYTLQPCLDPPKIKTARRPKADLVSRENVLEGYNLANDAAWWRACSVGTRGCAYVCMMNAQASRLVQVGRDGLTGQGVFEYAGTMRDE